MPLQCGEACVLEAWEMHCGQRFEASFLQFQKATLGTSLALSWAEKEPTWARASWLQLGATLSPTGVRNLGFTGAKAGPKTVPMSKKRWK